MGSGYGGEMRSRVVAGVLAGMLAVGLTGCTGGDPQPSPTPTPPFASTDAAYEAAEATYRGYVDAGNQVDLADPKTFEPVYAWLLGDALGTDKKELTAMAAHGWQMRGDSKITVVEPLAWPGSDPTWGDVRIAACVDVHALSVTDSVGKSMVLASRPDVQPVKVTFSRDASTTTGMKIVKIQKRDGKPLCGG